MRRKIGDFQDRQGNPVEVAVLESPEPEGIVPIVNYVAFKGEIWRWQVEQLFKEDRTPAVSHLYCALGPTGKLMSIIMTVEALGIGIFGHVYTDPDHRRKGLSKMLCGIVTGEFKERGGKVLNLGTIYGGIAFRLYQSVGFKSLWNTGFMRFADNPESFYETFYAPAETEIKEAGWQDYPVLSDLALHEWGSPIRCVAFGAIGPYSLEGIFIEMKKKAEASPEQSSFLVLRKRDTGAAVGFASLLPDPRWRNETFILDVFVHPNFEADYARLLEAIKLPRSKIIAYATERSEARTEALLTIGFKEEGLLRAQMRTLLSDSVQNVKVLGLLKG